MVEAIAENFMSGKAPLGAMRWPAALLAVLLTSTILAGCLAPEGDPGPPEDPVQEETPQAPSYMIPRGVGGMADEEAIGIKGQDIIFGGSLKHPLTRVLLVPPAHGDLGSAPNGPSFQEYLDVTILGIKEWLIAIERFVADYPEYDYLLAIDIEIEVFDSATPPSAAGYDIVAGYVETAGPLFRGVAVDPGVDTQALINQAGLGDLVHYGNRYMLMSLLSSAPRAGQETPDYPELNDLESVTMHEFAHVWGIGHTTTWTDEYGPDLMNSPYAWVYGDGDPVGDGGVRTPLTCISTLNLYALAYAYRWLPDGTWEGTSDMTVDLPEGMEYKLYCRDGTYNVTNVPQESEA
jgi:hypothetical protein